MKAVVSTLGLLLIVSTVASATPKLEADSGPNDIQNRVLDCADAMGASCGDVLTGTVGAAPGNIDLYACTGLGYGGSGESVYEICVAADGDLTVTMTYAHDGATNDLDLFLLGSCDENDCIDFDAATSGTEVVSAFVTAGTYYVVVDGWDGAGADGSGHTISVDCADPCVTPIDETTWGDLKSRF